jgi:hypothetical protein
MATPEIDGAVPDPTSATARPLTQKWLAFGDSAASWRLPDDTNLDHLEALIKAAMRSADPLAIEVQDDTTTNRTCLVLNGRALPFVVLSEGRHDR